MLHFAFREVGVFDFERYYGWTPDNLHDAMRESSYFDLIHEGEL
jgi:hypothetical protein